MPIRIVKNIGMAIIIVMYNNVGVFTYSIFGSDLEAGRNGATSVLGRYFVIPVGSFEIAAAEK